MKIVVGIIAFEEADFIGACIDNLLPYVDKIVVLEGAWATSKKVIGYRSSRDGTNEILDRYDDRVKIIHYSGKNQIDHISKLYNECMKFKPDWFLLSGADEFYRESDLQNIRKFLNEQTVDLLWVPVRLYWNDFYHYNNTRSIRFMRVTPGSSLHHLSLPSYNNGKHYVPIYRDFPTMFHMSYVRSLDRHRKKMVFRKESDKKNLIHSIKGNIILKGGFKNEVEFRNSLNIGNLGQLPIVLQNHPFRVKRW